MFLDFWFTGKGLALSTSLILCTTKISLKYILGEYSAKVETAETAESVDQLLSSYSRPPSSI